MPKKAIRPTQARTSLCHSGLSTPLPLLTPGRPLILTLAKHAIKHELFQTHRNPPVAGKAGDYHKGAIQPWEAFLFGTLKGDFK